MVGFESKYWCIKQGYDIIRPDLFLTINEITTNGEPRVREEARDLQAQVPEPESRQWVGVCVKMGTLHK